MKIWKITTVISLILLLATFTPLVIPARVYTPEIFGMPYTLWIGFLIMILMLANIFFAARNLPENHDK
jgi:hypothetical protein